LLRLPLIAPEPRHAHRRAQLPRLCLLLTRNTSARSKYFSAFSVSGAGDLSAISGNAMYLGLAPFLLRPFYFLYRVVNATPSIVKLAKFRMSRCQQ